MLKVIQFNPYIEHSYSQVKDVGVDNIDQWPLNHLVLLLVDAGSQFVYKWFKWYLLFAAEYIFDDYFDAFLGLLGKKSLNDLRHVFYCEGLLENDLFAIVLGGVLVYLMDELVGFEF